MDAEFNTSGSADNIVAHDETMNAEWLATVSHELRSPLTAIQGYVDLLLRHEERLTDGERREFLLEIRKGSYHLASMLDRFLLLARFEAGDVSVHLEPVDLIPLIRQMPLTFPVSLGGEAGEMGDAQRTIHVQTDGDAQHEDEQRSIVVMADKLLLHMMLGHLLENAHKYSPPQESIDIWLGLNTVVRRKEFLPEQILAHIESSQQDMVEIRIRDYGIGIPPQYHESIFQRFYRVDRRLTRDVAGLGLGLTLCKYIVTLHHGVIWVESLPGLGSTMHVLLPVH